MFDVDTAPIGCSSRCFDCFALALGMLYVDFWILLFIFGVATFA